jgi:hypothetical protein
MAFKPNYRVQRADRDRAQKARTAEKLKQRQERADKRKAEQDPQSVEPQAIENGGEATET